MKEKIKEFLALPPVIALITLVAYALISPFIPHPAERMSVSTFMEYHSIEEIVDFLEECGGAEEALYILAEDREDLLFEMIDGYGPLEDNYWEYEKEGYEKGFEEGYEIGYEEGYTQR